MFVDLKKAFDTVDHTILLKNYIIMEFRGNAPKWFESFLTNRSQYVLFNGEKSDIRDITYGIPQGSILGP